MGVVMLRALLKPKLKIEVCKKKEERFGVDIFRKGKQYKLSGSKLCGYNESSLCTYWPFQGTAFDKRTIEK